MREPSVDSGRARVTRAVSFPLAASMRTSWACAWLGGSSTIQSGSTRPGGCAIQFAERRQRTEPSRPFSATSSPPKSPRSWISATSAVKTLSAKLRSEK
jgi:hypothetical protein